MGFIATIQHDGHLFIAGQPRRPHARPERSPVADPVTMGDESAWQSAWPQVQAVATTLWLVAKRNVRAAVERVAADAADGAIGPTAQPRTARPLRVLHVVDSAGGSGRGGRMVISGRMADVCAELERLAAWEARHARC